VQFCSKLLKTADTLHEDLHAFLCASAAQLAKYLTAQNVSKNKSFRDEHSTHFVSKTFFLKSPIFRIIKQRNAVHTAYIFDFT